MSTPQSNTSNTDLSEDDSKPTPSTTAKYNTGKSTTEEPQPDVFTENADQLKEEFTDSNSEQDTDEDQASEHKYGDLIDRSNRTPVQEQTEEDEYTLKPELTNIKGNYHSENRFFQRANNHEDVPNLIETAWKQGVKVNINHTDIDNFYGYYEARYHEPADVILIANEDGMIEATLTNFPDTVEIVTDHLLRCPNESCGRLYNKKPNNECCHWCGSHDEYGRLKPKTELLPNTSQSHHQ